MTTCITLHTQGPADRAARSNVCRQLEYSDRLLPPYENLLQDYRASATLRDLTIDDIGPFDLVVSYNGNTDCLFDVYPKGSGAVVECDVRVIFWGGRIPNPGRYPACETRLEDILKDHRHIRDNGCDGTADSRVP